VPGYEVSSWFGIGAPKHVSADIIDLLNATINSGLSDLKLKNQLTGLSDTVLPGSPADFGKLIADETDKWRKLIQAAKIKLT
jgi:tripartite-type tricarboxylate transporter receptor subunit TctC